MSCDACGENVPAYLGCHVMDVAPTPDPGAVSKYTVRLCRKCEVGAKHAAARFVAYARRSRGAEPLWPEGA